jgi:hypothetical protein
MCVCVLVEMELHMQFSSLWFGSNKKFGVEIIIIVSIDQERFYSFAYWFLISRPTKTLASTQPRVLVRH